jgi:hypothetical protein
MDIPTTAANPDIFHPEKVSLEEKEIIAFARKHPEISFIISGTTYNIKEGRYFFQIDNPNEKLIGNLNNLERRLFPEGKIKLELLKDSRKAGEPPTNQVTFGMIYDRDSMKDIYSYPCYNSSKYQ